MSWYLQHQRARDIIAEHQREAARLRLARTYDQAGYEARPDQLEHSPIRRAIGGVVLAFGEAMTRVGRALDDPESTPNA